MYVHAHGTNDDLERLGVKRGRLSALNLHP
jgi:hypothetical protein